MDEMIGGALLAHVMQTPAAVDNSGAITQLSAQNAKLYAKYCESIKDYNALVDEFNKLSATREQERQAAEAAISKLRNDLAETEAKLERLQTRYDTVRNELSVQTVLVGELVNESSKTPGHDERPLSSRQDLRDEMISSLRVRLKG